jgi:diguanylate cyclase (GGDEF)-like protein
LVRAKGARVMVKGFNILVVDDDVNLSSALQDILETEGYSTSVAHNGQAALSQCHEKAFALSILDIKLPDTGGLQLLASLKKMYTDMAVIMVTGYASMETAVQALNEGASAYITKPLNMDEVLIRVREVLERQYRAVENRRLYEKSRKQLTRHKQSEETLRYLAYHDALTGLPNRLLLKDRLTLEVTHAHRNQQKLAVISLDLDRFKDVNDTFGHEVGDKLLQAVGDRLMRSVRRSDTVARVGGDEFVLILPELARMKDATRIAQKILVAIRELFVPNSCGLLITTSIGIAIYPDNGKDYNTLMKNADTAMYYAKDKGGNNYQCCSGAENTRLYHEAQQKLADRKLAEQQNKQHKDRPSRAMRDIIQALAMTVEMSDRYTARHQHRVSELSYAIAKGVGLSKKQIETIHMAASIHDIGKAYVPAEILNKPSQLTKTEFNIIKGHPKNGYKILKNLECPWPIAQMVLQHHERMDGSGYPRGLSGENILLEARILAVADVVEAISSDRPYRPALGQDEALKQISQNSGILYDPEVVDACLQVFAKGSFKFEQG